MGSSRFRGSCSLCVDGGGLTRPGDGLPRPPHRGWYAHPLRHPRMPLRARRRTPPGPPRHPGAPERGEPARPGLRPYQPVRPQPLPSPSRRPAAAGIPDGSAHRGETVLLPRPSLPPPPAIATVASGLDRDGAAVRAAPIEPWSSGQAEGQITRLKLIKRQSYGRAGLDLLKRRMILAASSTQSEQQPRKRGNPTFSRLSEAPVRPGAPQARRCARATVPRRPRSRRR